MDLKFWLEIVLIFILVFVSGFFSASEIAIIAVRKSRIKELARSGNGRAGFVEKLKNNPDSFFAIVQVRMSSIDTGIHNTDRNTCAIDFT